MRTLCEATCNVSVSIRKLFRQLQTAIAVKWKPFPTAGAYPNKAGECCEITVDSSTITVCIHMHLLFCRNLLHESSSEQSIMLSVTQQLLSASFQSTFHMETPGTLQRMKAQRFCHKAANLQHNVVQPSQPACSTIQFRQFFPFSGAFPTKSCNNAPINDASSVRPHATS
jgi:hypothetical protein